MVARPCSAVRNLLLLLLLQPPPRCSRTTNEVNSARPRRAENRGIVSRLPGIGGPFFLACPVSRPRVRRFASSSVSVAERSRPGKWDSHLNTWRQSRLALRPPGPLRVRAGPTETRRSASETRCIAKRCSRTRETEKRRETTREETRTRCPCPSISSRRSGFEARAKGTPFATDFTR